MAATVLVKTTSHRSRAKLETAVGKQTSYFSFEREGTFYRLTPEQAELALTITGVGRARERAEDDLLAHWHQQR